MEKRQILESGQKTYKMSLTHLVVPERKVLKKQTKTKYPQWWDCVIEHKKELPMAKAGTVWAFPVLDHAPKYKINAHETTLM